MSAPKHTPGPWFVEPILLPPLNRRRACGGVIVARGVNIATVWGDEEVEPSFRTPKGAEADANAALVAAAPELLEALRKCVGALVADVADDSKDYPTVVHEAWAAIAKAKGTAPT